MATSSEQPLAVEKHVEYIQDLDNVRRHSCLAPPQQDQSLLTPISIQHDGDLEYWYTEHLRLSGLYWGLTALRLLRHPAALPWDRVVDFVLSCQHANGGFGSAPGHDAHMLYVVSAVQILATLDALHVLDDRGVKGGRDQVAQCEDAFHLSLRRSCRGVWPGL